MYVLFQWFEVTSIELFLFAFVYSSRNINRNMYETFFHIIGCKSHAWLIKIKIRNYFSLKKKNTKKLAYCATTKKVDLISLSPNT